jgi:hypothetical protein
MTKPQRLFTINDVAGIVGINYKTITRLLESDPSAPAAEFWMPRGSLGSMQLWSAAGVARWQEFHAKEKTAVPTELAGYSDHKALNKVGAVEVTWKLWFRSFSSDVTQWWFSTPEGWWTSIDDGESWQFTGLQLRPTHYRYSCVNGNVTASGVHSGVLKQTYLLRRRLERKVEA